MLFKLKTFLKEYIIEKFTVCFTSILLHFELLLSLILENYFQHLGNILKCFYIFQIFTCI